MSSRSRGPDARKHGRSQAGDPAGLGGYVPGTQVQVKTVLRDVSCRRCAAGGSDAQRVTHNPRICAHLNGEDVADSRFQIRSEIVRTNNNAPFLALRNCEERCRLRTSGRKGQRIRVLGRTTVR